MLTFFDISILSIIGLFLVLGMLRGFLDELFSLFNWLFSALFTALLRPLLNNLVAKSISNPLISNIVSAIIIFVIVIIGFSMLTKALEEKIKTKIPKSINFNLGMGFGFIKGFLIGSLVFLTVLSVYGDTEDLATKSGPEWLQNSITYRPLSFGGYILLPLYNSMSGNINKQLEQEKVINAMIKEVEEPDKKGDEETGYKEKQREELNHLIDIVE
ncbi:MAG: hypothetical protein Ta2D_00600 [Rickettsiales bacterium]|nr:MAG: hypothetical protein Ta2D_00600 [Rickettsiales bacterium]